MMGIASLNHPPIYETQAEQKIRHFGGRFFPIVGLIEASTTPIVATDIALALFRVERTVRMRKPPVGREE